MFVIVIIVLIIRLLCLIYRPLLFRHIYHPHHHQSIVARSMRSNHSTWDPRRPLYEELKAPPVPRRHYHGSDDCYHSHPPGSRLILFLISLFFWLIYCIGF